MMRSRRMAMTLVELLVVLGILSVVLALLLPAIQKVRATADKMVCASRLRQVGLAAHHYHADFGKLPPGYFGPSLGNNAVPGAFYKEGQALGHLPLLLPYLEQDKVQARLDVSFATQAVSHLPWFWLPGKKHHEPNYLTAQHRIKLFQCPSASAYTPLTGERGPGGGGTIMGAHVYNDVDGVHTVGYREPYVSAAKYCFLGRTNYTGVAGCGSGTNPLYSKYAGVYTNRTQVSLGQIAAMDGTSNTLLYGETVGSQWDGSPAEAIDLSWMGGGALGTYLGTLRGREAPVIAFSSFHPGGVPFCFADGSVRTVRYFKPTGVDENYTAQWYLLQQLAGYKDGSAADVSDLLD